MVAQLRNFRFSFPVHSRRNDPFRIALDFVTLSCGGVSLSKIPMECLRIPGVAVPCNYNSFSNSVKASNFSSSGVLCLSPSRRGRRRSRKNGCLSLSGSVLGESDDREYQTSQIYKDRPKEEGKGLVLGTQRDSSGSVIGFHLFPPPGNFFFFFTD